jgi:hypothetical protein
MASRKLNKPKPKGRKAQQKAPPVRSSKSAKRRKRAAKRGGTPAKGRKTPAKPDPKPENGPQKDKLYGQSELGRLFGRSQQAVSKWTRSADWSWGAGPWTIEQLDEIRDFVARLQPDRSVPDVPRDVGPPPTMSKWEAETLLKLEEVHAKRRFNAEADGKLHDTTLCAAEHVAFHSVARARLLELPTTIPDRVDGLSQAQRDQLRRLLAEGIDSALSSIHLAEITLADLVAALTADERATLLELLAADDPQEVESPPVPFAGSSPAPSGRPSGRPSV